MHLNYTYPDGHILFVGNIILMIVLLPLLIWFCFQFKNKNKTAILHVSVFAIVSALVFCLGTVIKIFPSLWWLVLPGLMLFGLGREIYSKIRYKDFGWDDLLYDFIGTFVATLIYWACYIVY
jgi:hypothetical protein